MLKRLYILLIGITSLVIPTSAASLWTPIADKLEASIVFIQNAEGSCTGFVIDNKRDYVLTAGHCNGEKMKVDGEPAGTLFVDERKDLLVLFAKGIDKPALKLSSVDPDRGDEVASMGYGWGLESPMFRISHVSDNHAEIEELSGPFILVDSQFVPGQSGGPVVNDKGEVVMIVQRGGQSVGLGVGAKTIKAKVGRYFE